MHPNWQLSKQPRYVPGLGIELLEYRTMPQSNEPYQPRLVGNFLITDLILLVVIVLFKFSVSSWFGLGRLYVFRDLSIFSGLSNLLAYMLVLFSYNPFCFCGVSHHFFSFILILFSLVLFFFFNETGWRFINLVYIFKIPDLGFTGPSNF